MTRAKELFVMKRQEIDPRFNKGNKIIPKYQSPIDILENENQDPKRKTPRSTMLTPPMQNLSYDPRVYRGNMILRIKGGDEPNLQRWRKIKKLRYSNTPEPIKGRLHIDVQTDVYLEDQSAKITYNDFDTQTDDFLDRPQTPYFIPWKSGPDAFTQIFPGDLFDFDMEVEPMCEVLAGRALEQGFMEVQEEKQLAHLRCHQDMFEQMRVAELTATQRMEAAEKRIMEEKERRLKQEQDRLKEEMLLKLRIEAMGISMRVLKKITDEIYDKLTKEGYFYDPVQRELEIHFIPSLIKDMQAEVGGLVNSRHAVAIMTDEVTPALDTSERAIDGMDIIMSRLLNVLDAWISFEDNEMVELAATEQATHRIMDKALGEVVLVDQTSTKFTSSLVDRVEGASTETSDGALDLIKQIVKGFKPQ